LAALLLFAALTVSCRSNAYLRQRAAEAMSRGRHKPAAKLLAEATHQNPTDWKAQMLAGKVALKRGRYERAEEALRKARALRPNHEQTPQIVDRLAEALYQQDKVSALRALLREAVQARPAVKSYLRQGEYLQRIGHTDEARVAFRQAIQYAAPNNPEPYLKLASFYEQLGLAEKAVRALRRAYGAAPGDEDVADRLRAHGIVPGPTVTLPPK
jgi:Flp pilus assembly protein TadD